MLTGINRCKKHVNTTTAEACACNQHMYQLLHEQAAACTYYSMQSLMNACCNVTQDAGSEYPDPGLSCVSTTQHPCKVKPSVLTKCILMCVSGKPVIGFDFKLEQEGGMQQEADMQ